MANVVIEDLKADSEVLTHIKIIKVYFNSKLCNKKQEKFVIQY